MQLNRFLFLAIILFITGCSSPKSFELKGVQSFKIEKLSLKENIINAQLNCYNPNGFDLELKKIDCDIFVNDQKLTHYLLETPINIPSSANFILPAKLQIGLNSILNHGVDLMFNKPFKIMVVGNATVSKGFFTKTIPINYTTTKTFNLKESVVRDLLKSVQGQLK